MAVAEALVASLARLVTDPGRRKLKALLLGSEQERVLRAVVDGAIRATANELFPGDLQQAEQLALVVGQVFNESLVDLSPSKHESTEAAIRACLSTQLAVLGDGSVTGTGESSADLLGVSADDIASVFGDNLIQEILARGARGGPLAPLADQLNHEVTHLQGAQLHRVVSRIADQLGLAPREDDRSAESTPLTSSERGVDVPLDIERSLDGLQLGDHDEAECRMHAVFTRLRRAEQQDVIEALIGMANTEPDHGTRLIICSLIEAASRLDPMLISTDDVETLADSVDDTLRTTAAVIMWQWAEVAPGRVPVHLLSRLSLPSTEDWYVHAPARAAAKQLILRRESARAVFDVMAASADVDDRDYAIADLAEIAQADARAVPPDIVRKLAHDDVASIADRARALRRITKQVSAAERRALYGSFGL